VLGGGCTPIGVTLAANSSFQCMSGVPEPHRGPRISKYPFTNPPESCAAEDVQQPNPHLCRSILA